MKGNFSFKTPEHNTSYFESGHVVMPLLNTEQIAKMQQVFEEHFNPAELPQVYDTIATEKTDTIEVVNDAINKVCADLLEKVALNYRIAGSIFIMKKSGDDSYKGVHLDASMTMEGYNNLGIWIPLCDVDEQVGRLCLLNNSHRFMPPYNTPSMPCPYSQVEHIVEPHLTCFDMKAGEALFFNNSMLHCTQKNTSGKTRVSVIIKLIDANAPMVTAYYNPQEIAGKQVKLYQHDYDFFIKGKFRQPEPPASSKFLGYVADLPKTFTKEEVTSLIQQYQPATV